LDGWAVEVTTKVLGGGTSQQVYYARFSDPSAAEEAVKKRVNATPDVKIAARKRVPANAFEAMKIQPSQVGQWMGSVPPGQ
jgi:hypothetical protein